MSTIREHRKLTTDLETAWSRLSDLEQVHHLISFLDSASVDGDRRTCRIAEGAPMAGELDEWVLSVDAELHRVAYSIVDGPFGFDHHAASMELELRGDELWLIWTTDVLPHAVADQMAGMFASEADHIAAQLSR